MAALGVRATLEEVSGTLAAHFGRIFDCEMLLEDAVLAGSGKREVT